MEFLYLIIILIIFTVAFRQISNQSWSRQALHLLFWGAGICLVALLYNIGDRIFQHRLIAQIQEEFQGGARNSQMGFRKAMDGHFYVDIVVGGIPINCLVDTGASDTILSQKDALKLGIDLQSLNYSKKYNTANGKIRAAPIALKDVYLNDFYIPYLEVSISEVAGQERSLLGMSFLKHFNFVIKKNILFLLKE